MYIKNIYMQRFMSFNELRLDLTKHKGITHIDGANGVGKSAILDAITWCLFGRLLRPTKKAKAVDVINRFLSGLRTLVTLTLVLDDGRELLVERSRGNAGPALVVSGLKDTGTTSGMQESLEGIIGINYQTFTSSVMFGGSISSFCAKTDAEKKQLIEEMLELDFYTDAQAAANVDAVSLSRELEQLKIKIENDKLRLKDYEQALTTSLSDKENWKENWFNRYYDLMDAASDSSDELLMCEDSLFADFYKFETDKKCILLEQHNWEVALESARLNCAKFQKPFEIAEKQELVAVDLFKTLKNKLSEVLSGIHPPICPTCGQCWHNKNKKDLDNFKLNQEKEIKKAGIELARLSKISIAKRVALDEANEVYANIENCEPDAIPDWNDCIRSSLRDYVEARTRHENSINNIRDHRRTKDTDIFTARVRELNAKIKKHRVVMHKDYVKSKDLELSLTYAEYWVRAFGKKGIPSYLIDAAVPSLNASVRDIASILTDGTMDVFFDNAAVKGSSQVLGVDVEFTNGGGTYDMVSRGEHARVDLTVLFALRELIASRGLHSWSQLFIDELFDGMDTEGLQAVMRLLRQRYGTLQIFIMSHDTELKGYADNTIKVMKEGNETMIVEA